MKMHRISTLSHVNRICFIARWNIGSLSNYIIPTVCNTNKENSKHHIDDLQDPLLLIKYRKFQEIEHFLRAIEYA